MVRRAVLAGTVMAGALAAPGPAAAQTGAEKPSVLVIYPEQAHLPAVLQVDAALRRSLDGVANVFGEHLDVSRFPGDAEQHAFRAFLLSRYAAHPPDLLVAVAAKSLDLIRSGGADLWPGVPTILLNVEKGSPASLRDADLVVRLLPDELGTAIDALQMFPQVDTLVLVAGTSPYDLRAIESARAALAPLSDRVAMRWLTGLGMSALLDSVAALTPGRTLLFYLTVFHDADGRPFVPREVLANIAAMSPVPIIGSHGSYLGHGVLGGRLLDYTRAGEEVASLIRGHLAGAAPSSPPPVPSQPVYDARQVARWHVPDARVPADARIEFATPSFWQQYRWLVLLTAGIIALESALIGALLTERRRRARAEAEVRRRLHISEELQQALEQRRAALHASQSRYRALVGHLIVAQEEAARGVAADLHDDVTQRLASAGLEAQAVAQRLPPGETTARADLNRLGETVRGVAGDLAHLARRLHPATLASQGLVGALRALARSASSDPNFQVELAPDTAEPELPSSAQLALYRVAQEATRNAQQHGEAHKVVLSLTRQGRHIRLVAADDGCGFDVDVQGTRGIGLITMRERMAMAGGSLTIDSQAGAGTRVVAEVPLTAHHGAPA